MSSLLAGCVSDKTEEAVLLEEMDSDELIEEQEEQVDEKYYVYICGEVKNPGVYTCSPGSRLFQILEQAGGFTDQAEISAINMAAKAEDGAKIYVPSIEEYLSEQVQSGSDGRININTASQSQLETIPGIGAVKAQEIISYRETHGNFKKPEDICNIAGIKEKAFDKMKDYITIE